MRREAEQHLVRVPGDGRQAARPGQAEQHREPDGHEPDCRRSGQQEEDAKTVGEDREPCPRCAGGLDPVAHGRRGSVTRRLLGRMGPVDVSGCGSPCQDEPDQAPLEPRERVIDEDIAAGHVHLEIHHARAPRWHGDRLHALQRLRDHVGARTLPNLTILDLTMPDLNGLPRTPRDVETSSESWLASQKVKLASSPTTNWFASPRSSTTGLSSASLSRRA
jgi:hypothetical protein